MTWKIHHEMEISRLRSMLTHNETETSDTSDPDTGMSQRDVNRIVYAECLTWHLCEVSRLEIINPS